MPIVEWIPETEVAERIEAAVLAEREACAKVCEELGRESGSDHEAGGMFECAAAIRARGEK